MADSDTNTEIRKRGRPPTAEPAQIADTALRLFERRGFDVVTMDEIADAAGVSARTLFRLFPTKSDLVWQGLREMRDVVSAQAGALRGKGLSPAEVLRAVAEPFLRPMEDAAAARSARRRLRVIAEAPALLNHPTLRELEDIVASLFDQENEPPALLARTVIAVAFGAIFWWAEHGEGLTPLEALSQALQGIARKGPARSKRTRIR
jgi:AcrR family transcriptional regulator